MERSDQRQYGKGDDKEILLLTYEYDIPHSSGCFNKGKKQTCLFHLKFIELPNQLFLSTMIRTIYKTSKGNPYCTTFLFPEWGRKMFID